MARRRLTVSVVDASLKLAEVQAKVKRLKARLDTLQREEAALQPFLQDRYDTDTDVALEDGKTLEVRLRTTPVFAPDLAAIQRDYDRRGEQVPYAKATVTKLAVRKRRNT